MGLYSKRFTLTTGLAAALLMASAGVASADDWKEYGGDCDTTAFSAPEDTSLKSLAKCGKLLLAYRNFNKIEAGEKGRVVEAMNLLYSTGSDKEAKTAKKVLNKLKAPLPKRGGGATATAKAAPAVKKAPPKPARVKFKADPPDKRAQKKADRHFKNGFKQYRKKKYDKALSYYLKMVDAAPGYEKAHYNVACMYAMTRDEPNAVKYLQNLQDLGTDTAIENLRLARSDSDFANIKSDSEGFKRVTGYTVWKVQNSLGEMGEDNVDNFVASLKKLGHEVPEVVPTEKKKTAPVVWYAPHAKMQAYIAKKLLNHPRTQTVELEVSRMKGYDVVVTWGDKIKNDEPKDWVSDPDDAEQKIDDLARKQDELLREPDAVIDDVDETLDKPGEVADKVDDTLKKPGEAVDKVGNTIDKATGLFK